jgi:mannose-6-phosphate isomerase
MPAPELPRVPLKLAGIPVEKPWGSRRLASALGKSLPPRKNIGESWEAACRTDACSAVAEGPLKGKTLDWLIQKFPKEILGTDIAGGWRGYFPLLVKFVDIAEPLSVQVHPSDEFAAIAEGDGAAGKIEAWVVLAAGKEARLWKGLVPGMTREKFEAALAGPDVEKALNAFPVSVGDVILMPPGTVHSAKDIVVAEFQQNSDTTYRLHDWGRKGSGGKSRELHLEKGLAAIDYHTTSVAKCQPGEIREHLRTFDKIRVRRSGGKGKREVLVWCRKFVVESLTLSGKAEFTGDASRFYLITAASGQGEFRVGGKAHKWKAGQTWYMPASLGAYEISSRSGRLLWCYVP